MRSRLEITQNEIKELIPKCKSYMEILRKLDLDETSKADYRFVLREVKESGLSIDHFTPAWNKGMNAKNNPDKILSRSIDDYLKDDGPKISSSKLKDKLLNSGKKDYKCECCENTEWNNKPIPLQLHHIDGNHNNNKLDNLQLLCPNCHAQTDNYCRPKTNKRINPSIMKKKNKKKKKNSSIKPLAKSITLGTCINCGKELTRKQTLVHNKFCSLECAHEAQKKRPEKDELEKKLKELKFNNIEVGKFYGVTEAAVRKCRKLYNLEQS